MFEKLLKALRKIRDFWCSEESNSIGEFIDRIADPDSHYKVTVDLRHRNQSIGDSIVGSVCAPTTYHCHYFFIASATSTSGDREVIFSRCIGEGGIISLTPDPGSEGHKQAAIMEEQAIREVEDLRERINRRLPDMTVEIILKNSIFSEDRII